MVPAIPIVVIDRTAATLHELIHPAICPLLGVSIGDPANVTTWSIRPDPSATQAQIDAANALIAAQVPPLNPTTINVEDFMARFTPAEQAAVWKAMQSEATGAIGAIYTLALTRRRVGLKHPATQQFVNALTTAGALTPARAAAILTP